MNLFFYLLKERVPMGPSFYVVLNEKKKDYGKKNFKRFMFTLF